MRESGTILHVTALISALAAVSCASTSAESNSTRPEPTITIATLEISPAAPSRAMSVPMIVRVRVTNLAGEPLTVDRIDVSSVGVGPYDIASTALDFHHLVENGHVATFPIWVQAKVSTAEQMISGQEAAMMMRAVVFLTSHAGSSRSTVVQRVDTTVSQRE